MGMARVTLPEGCTGLDMQDKTRYTASREGYVTVSDEHASAIRKGYYGQVGLITPDALPVSGTRGTMWCTSCIPYRRWNIWNVSCPRCGAETYLEEE